MLGSWCLTPHSIRFLLFWFSLVTMNQKRKNYLENACWKATALVMSALPWTFISYSYPLRFGWSNQMFIVRLNVKTSLNKDRLEIYKCILLCICLSRPVGTTGLRNQTQQLKWAWYPFQLFHSLKTHLSSQSCVHRILNGNIILSKELPHNYRNAVRGILMYLLTLIQLLYWITVSSMKMSLARNWFGQNKAE